MVGLDAEDCNIRAYESCQRLRTFTDTSFAPSSSSEDLWSAWLCDFQSDDNPNQNAIPAKSLTNDIEALLLAFSNNGTMPAPTPECKAGQPATLKVGTARNIVALDQLSPLARLFWVCEVGLLACASPGNFLHQLELTGAPLITQTPPTPFAQQDLVKPWVVRAPRPAGGKYDPNSFFTNNDLGWNFTVYRFPTGATLQGDQMRELAGAPTRNK